MNLQVVIIFDIPEGWATSLLPNRYTCTASRTRVTITVGGTYARKWTPFFRPVEFIFYTQTAVLPSGTLEGYFCVSYVSFDRLLREI